MAGKQRPTGVAVLSILAAIIGILCLIGALVLGILATAMESLIEEYAGITGMGAFVSAMVTAIAAVAAIVGILYLIVAYALWTGKGWAWWLTIILSVIGIFLGLLSIPWGIITIFIEILIIYYLTRLHVKNFFGKGVLVSHSPPPSLTSSDSRPAIRCPNCGYNTRTNFNYCGKCGAPLREEETKIF